MVADSFRIDRLAGMVSAAKARTYDRSRCGVARRTSEGSLECYMRIAPADRDLVYFNRDGSKRVEHIPASTLFRVDSAGTNQLKPITLHHPQGRKVTPDNALGLTHGSTGNLLLRENTPYGDFLGIVAAVHSKAGIEAAEKGWEISPGYGVQIRQDSASGKFVQTDRTTNHIAIVERARGGQDIGPILNGIHLDSWRSDAEDDRVDGDLDVWQQRFHDEQLNAVPFNCDQVFGALDAFSMGHSGVWEPQAINLDRYKLEVEEVEEEEEEGEGYDEYAASADREVRTKGGVKMKVKPGESPPGHDPPGHKSKERRNDSDHSPRKTMTTIKIGGQDYEVSDSVKAALVAPLERADAYDTLYGLYEQETERNDELQEELEFANQRADSAEAMAVLHNDAADDDGADFAAQLAGAIVLIDGIRQDGMLLVDTGRLEEFNVDAGSIVNDLDSIQREMIKAVAPALSDRCDGWTPGEVSANYETLFTQFRADAEEEETRNDSEGLPMSQDLYRASGRHMPMFSSGEEIRNDMSHKRGGKRGPSLTDIPAVVTPTYASASSVQALLKKIEAEDDRAYQEATKRNEPKTGNSVPQVRLM